MTTLGIIKILLYVLILVLITKPLGTYIKKVVCREKTFLDKILSPIEKGIYKLCLIDSETEQNWKSYAVSVLLFSLFGFIFLFCLQLFQYHLPFNPEKFTAVPGILSINTAISFVTNTNWQAYGGETTLSYFVQMTGMTVQNFVSAATGIAVAVALFRSFARKQTDDIGNFWVDLTRITLWILLPLSVVISIFYIFQGVPQNISNYVIAHTLEGGQQIIPQGPVATQEVIKSLGTNGGGFFSANSMHPYENPTGLTNYIQVLTIFAIGAALTYTFGLMIKSTKQGWTILVAMFTLFIILTFCMYYCEGAGNPKIAKADSIASASGYIPVNMEGKEVRFGIDDSVLYTAVTTSASDGGVNSDIDSYNPLPEGIAMFNMAIGEIIIGGVGTGMYGMLMFILLTVFIAGLMVGRSPEFLGKKISVNEMKWVMIALLISPFCVLFLTALACFSPVMGTEFTEYGPHGFSRILYAFISASNNNGSALSGINTTTDFFNITTGIAMLLGRFVTIIAVLAVAGSIAKKKIIPVSSGTFPTTGPIFIVLLLICILIIGGLNFFPALALGPIAEHFMLF